MPLVKCLSALKRQESEPYSHTRTPTPVPRYFLLNNARRAHDQSSVHTLLQANGDVVQPLPVSLVLLTRAPSGCQ
jgi:hypothetical protein